MENKNEIVKVIESSKVEPETGKYLKEKFLPFFEQADEWRKKAQELVVADASQTHEMKMAREARLALREIRINADKTRKLLKEDSLRYGKAVQGVYNVIEYLIVPIEKHLEEQEKFIEIQEQKKKNALKAKREIEIEPFREFISPFINLGELPEEDYTKLLKGAQLQFQQKKEDEQKIEQERIAKEKEQERIRQENERLRKELEVKEMEIKVKEQQEMAKQKEEVALKDSPDKDKLLIMADRIAKIEFPVMRDDNAKWITTKAKGMLIDVANYIRKEAQSL
jgi:hypothetical protein